MLKVEDNGIIMQITYEDMIKYHGRTFIAGVAMAYKLLELVAQEIPGGCLSRERFSILLGVNGPGIIDGLEMTTRAKSRGDLAVMQEIAWHKDAPNAEDGHGGKYYFEIQYDQQKISATVKSELIPKEFLQLSAKTHNNSIRNGEKVRLQQLKEEIAARLIEMDAAIIFNWNRI